MTLVFMVPGTRSKSRTKKGPSLPEDAPFGGGAPGRSKAFPRRPRGSLFLGALAFAAALSWAGGAKGQEPPETEPSDVLDALLSGFLGFQNVTGEELEQEVAQVGEVPFRSPVPLAYLDRAGLSRYLSEVFDAEYPQAKADADARMLTAFGFLEPGTDLRRLRAKVLLDNVVGFYDDRPGKKKLYAVSANPKLTPTNQIILAHELRHALQDQYMDTHSLLDDSIGDFDDRHLAMLCLLEGDATFLMERFLLKQLPAREDLNRDLSGTIPMPTLEDVPDVVRDELLLPYTSGLEFVQALWNRGGWAAVRRSWNRPPRSTEQVLHPAKYFAQIKPRRVGTGYFPKDGKVVSEGVLGEMLAGTLLGEGSKNGANGWAGDAFRVFETRGHTLLVWRAVWDEPSDGRAFARALERRLQAVHGPPVSRGPFSVYAQGAWRFALGGPGGFTLMVSSDDDQALFEALDALLPAP